MRETSFTNSQLTECHLLSDRKKSAVNQLFQCMLIRFRTRICPMSIQFPRNTHRDLKIKHRLEIMNAIGLLFVAINAILS
jgi:hypothetical protein